MVKCNFLIVCIAIITAFPIFAQEVKVTAEIEGNGIAGQPLKGTTIVTHDKKDSVDTGSFILEKKPLQVKLIQEVPLSADSTLIMSIYQFEIPPKEKGLYALPEVSVVVGGKRYVSIPSTFAVKEAKPDEVKKGSKTPAQVAPAASDSKEYVILKLENLVPATTTLYPGQRIKVGYKYSFNFGFDLTKEEIPLLKAEGFSKIGAKDVKEGSSGKLSILKITQEIQAVKPGKFTFGPSIIEGRAYKTNSLNQKIVDQNVARSEAPAVTFEVLPFPEEGKPSSFKGAVGDYGMEVSLESPSEVSVGDKMTVLVKVTGPKEVSDIALPEVCCQPGFSGFFRMSDLPPEEKSTADSKEFRVEMRPLNPSVSEIPSFEFSFFNPNSKTYKTLTSKPIPIKVVPLKAKPAEEVAPLPIKTKEDKVEIATPEVGPIEIGSIYPLDQSDLHNQFLGTWWVLIIIPLGIGALLLQMQMKHYLEKEKTKVRPKKSYDLFNNILKLPPHSSEFFTLLQRAFLVRLFERKEIPSPDVSIDSLPERGMPGKVKAFLKKIETARFSGKAATPGKDLYEEAGRLFKELL